MSTPSALVSKLWNHCSILRDDGLSFGDYVEQLTASLVLWRTLKLLCRAGQRVNPPRARNPGLHNRLHLVSLPP